MRGPQSKSDGDAMNKKLWLAERRRGIGGSDAAAILGFSPWKSPIEVYLEKTGEVEEQPEDKQKQFLLDLGQDLEPVIAKLYERETGRELVKPAPARWRHPKYPVLIGTPDRIVPGVGLGVEIKSENQFSSEFGEPGTDQVPYHYLIQCAHYMSLGDYQFWDVALLHGGARFSIYRINRDPELEGYMIDELIRWWDKHIVGGELPEVDASPGWKTFLRRRYPSNILPVLDTDVETISEIRRLALARHALACWENEKTEIETRLKLAIGEHEGFAGDFGKITWRKTKDSEVTNFARAFDWLAEDCKLPELSKQQILEACTHTKPGIRRFLFTPRKEWYGSFREEDSRKLSGFTSETQIGNSESTPEAS
jgi:putative phage-type endonuclease